MSTANAPMSTAPAGLRLSGAVLASIVAGLVAGFVLGSRTGVREGVEAGRSVDPETLARALAWKTEIAVADLDGRREIARLLEELRSARAQIEALRHAKEELRVAERLRGLEAARDSAERAAAAAAARAARLERRLERLERMQVDPTPTGSLPKKGAAR